MDNPDKLQELSLNAFSKKSNIVSLTTQHYSGERRSIQGNAPESTKLVTSKYDSARDWITYYFLTEATEKYPKDYAYKDTDPTKNFQMERNPSELYEIELRFFNVSRVTKIQNLTAKEIKNFLWNTDFALWSNAPSFHWQGFNYKMSQIGASLFPTDIAPTSKHINKDGKSVLGWADIHGNALIDKHLYDLFLHLTWFLNQMSSALINALRSDGTMPKYQRPSRAKPKPPQGTTPVDPVPQDDEVMEPKINGTMPNADVQQPDQQQGDDDHSNDDEITQTSAQKESTVKHEANIKDQGVDNRIKTMTDELWMELGWDSYGSNKELVARFWRKSTTQEAFIIGTINKKYFNELQRKANIENKQLDLRALAAEILRSSNLGGGSTLKSLLDSFEIALKHARTALFSPEKYSKFTKIFHINPKDADTVDVRIDSNSGGIIALNPDAKTESVWVDISSKGDMLIYEANSRRPVLEYTYSDNSDAYKQLKEKCPDYVNEVMESYIEVLESEQPQLFEIEIQSYPTTKVKVPFALLDEGMVVHNKSNDFIITFRESALLEETIFRLNKEKDFAYSFDPPLVLEDRKALWHLSGELKEYELSFSKLLKEDVNAAHQGARYLIKQADPDVISFSTIPEGYEPRAVVKVLHNLIKSNNYSIFTANGKDTRFFAIKREKAMPLLYSLREGSESKLVCAVGSFFPVTKDHIDLCKKVMKTAKETEAKNLVIILRDEENYDSDMVSLNQKAHALRIAVKGLHAYADESIVDFYDAMIYAYNKHIKNIIIIAGSDDVREYQSILDANNGKKSSRGYFKFDSAKVISTGGTNPDKNKRASQSINAILNGSMEDYLKVAEIPYYSSIARLFKIFQYDMQSKIV